MTLDSIVQCISQVNICPFHILQCMSDDATELFVRRYELVGSMVAITDALLEPVKLLLAVFELTLKFHVALSSVLGNAHYFSGG